MSDFKSKLPTLHELTRWTGKLFKDVKQSVSEIFNEYKQKRAEEEAAAQEAEQEQPTQSPTSVEIKEVKTAPPPKVAPSEKEPASTENNVNKEPINKDQ